MIDIPLGSRSYKLRSLPISSQNLINLYPKLHQADAKSQITVHATPAIVQFANIGDGPIRALHKFGGLLYVISGTKLYSVSQLGVGTLLGDVGTTDIADITSNQGQLIVVNGTSKGYVYTTEGGVADITDTDFKTAYTCDFINQFILFSSDNDQFFVSNVNDGTLYDAADIATAETEWDGLLTVRALNNRVWFFGGESIDIYYPDATATPTFSKITGGSIDKGTAARFSVASYDKTFYWLGNDKAVYKSMEAQAIPISDEYVEYTIGQMDTIDDARGYCYRQEKEVFYVLNFPSENKTLVWGESSGRWHERQRFNDGLGGRHRSNCHCYCYGKHLVGDFENGKIYYYDLGVYADEDEALLSKLVTPPIHKNGDPFSVAELIVDMEVGRGLLTGQGSDPKMMLRVSKDSGWTYGPEKHLSLGTAAKYKTRVRKQALGYTRKDMAFELSITDPVPRNFIKLGMELG